MPEKILSLFIKDATLVASGRTNALLAISVFPLLAIMIINLTLFQAMGKAKPAGILVISRQLLFYIPAVLLLPLVFGVRGVWVAAPAVDSVVMVISVFITVKLFATELKTESAHQ